MKIKEIIKGVLKYYDRTRAVGHTSSTIQGLKLDEKVLMVANYLLARQLSDSYEIPLKNFISIEDLAGDKMLGVRQPIIWDNFSIIEILSMALSEIERLEAELQRVEK